MKALKALVIGMGLLILLGLAVVIATVVSRVGNDEAGTATRPGTEAGPRPEPAALDLGLGESCRVDEVTAVGRHVVLRLSGPLKDGCGELLVLEPVAGTAVRRLVPHATLPGGAGTSAASPAE